MRALPKQHRSQNARKDIHLLQDPYAYERHAFSTFLLFRVGGWWLVTTIVGSGSKTNARAASYHDHHAITFDTWYVQVRYSDDSRNFRLTT